MLPGQCNGRVENFNVSLEDLMPYYKLILPIVNSFSGDTETFYPQIYKPTVKQKIIKISVMAVA